MDGCYSTAEAASYKYNLSSTNWTSDYDFAYEDVNDSHSTEHASAMPGYYFYIPICLCIFGIFENILSLLAIAHVRRQGDAMYHLLGNLCVADTFLLILAVVYYIIHDILHNKSVLSTAEWMNVVCLSNFLRCLLMTAIFAEAFTTVGLVVFTTLKVLQPLRSLYLLHSPWIWIPIAAIWILSFILGFLFYILATSHTPVLTYWCICVTYGRDSSYLDMENKMLAVTISVSIVVVALCYVKIIHIARNARRRHRHSHHRAGSDTSLNSRPGESRFSFSEPTVAYQNKRQQCVVYSNGKTSSAETKTAQNHRKHAHENTTKVAMTALLLFGVLLVLWLPYVVVSLIPNRGMFFSYVVTSVFFLNAILDPLIYGIRLQRMRNGYELMFKRCFAFLKREKGLSGDRLHMSQRSASFSRATQLTGGHTRRLSSRNGSLSVYLPRQSSANRFL